jgi:hypothetical protein
MERAKQLKRLQDHQIEGSRKENIFGLVHEVPVGWQQGKYLTLVLVVNRKYE